MHRFDLGLVRGCTLLALALAAAACEDDEQDDSNAQTMNPATADDGGSGAGGALDAGADAGPVRCTKELRLPDGFCATVFADALGPARHMTVTPAGDLFVAISGKKGGVRALRDADGNGAAERVEEFGEKGGTGIAWRDGKLYFAEDGRILRYDLKNGELTPDDEPAVVVKDLPDGGDHTAKAIGFDALGRLVVNIASASNACQKANREPGSEGKDPCPELDVRAGLWRFDPDEENQTEEDGTRLVTGVRNGTAFDLQPRTGELWVALNGRDQLADNWPESFTEAQDQRLPGEEIWRLREGGDHGWPYCYYDPRRDAMLLAPEYGGDGKEQGRCERVDKPQTFLPAHWAPLSLHFYRGRMFPERYRGGAFVASHGSRFLEDAPAGRVPGYNVVFLPWSAAGLDTHEAFARGFAGRGRPLPDEAKYRPVGLAEGPDGALYVSDDVVGRIWRITYLEREELRR